MFNGLPGMGMVHYAEGRVVLADLRRRVASSVSCVVLRNIPSQPSMGKWTKAAQCIFLLWEYVTRVTSSIVFVTWISYLCGKKAAPCMMFFNLGGMFGILPQLVDISFRDSLAGRAPADAAAAAVPDDERDPEFDWHHVAGKRYHRFQRVMRNDDERFVILAISIVLEPTRYLTKFFMAASNRPRLYDRPAPLLDLLRPQNSPVVSAAQYLSHMLRGQASNGTSRLSVLWCASGYDTMQEWQRHRPDQAQLVRRHTVHSPQHH